VNETNVVLAGFFFLGAGELCSSPRPPLLAADTAQERRKERSGLPAPWGIEKVSKIRACSSMTSRGVRASARSLARNFRTCIGCRVFGSRDLSLDRGVHSADGLVQAGRCSFQFAANCHQHEPRVSSLHVRRIHAFAKSRRTTSRHLDFKLYFCRMRTALGSRGCSPRRQENRHVTQKLLKNHLSNWAK